ncbi:MULTISPECIES: 50S ribosomal protein L32 [Pseudopedobacter]|uniref:Large ribosomal subunit protein bL32 n=1 Tax=Pseudopedobacter saltans (strain ATCC 51119 / DSM 12145 / JCM 21818 / CCUG 39354 / LMG 10337 / NBRC 100064 / NCIMB 13643) TaxID=762903 RepID=F0SBZ9_PSESL|nr:50S ribosomal protein L32 [Pseudopedobacter saltans]ADY53840.1 ribosomal protein L32 [Pseudopedobacter saltans DSM 12145]
MAHPKRKTSKARRDKRRTHYKAEAPALWVCKETGAVHLPHRAYNVDGNLYYKGKLIIENTAIA